MAGLVILVSGVLPTSWRLTADRDALPALRDTLAAREADLGLLRTNLQSLSQEARRQVHWADLLTTFGRHIPGALRLQLVETQRSSPPTPPGQPAAAQSKVDESLRIEALTSLRPGSGPLVDVAQFIAGLMRDPAVSRRFELKSWEIKPSPAATATGEQFLNVSILLVERPQ